MCIYLNILLQARFEANIFVHFNKVFSGKINLMNRNLNEQAINSKKKVQNMKLGKIFF